MDQTKYVGEHSRACTGRRLRDSEHVTIEPRRQHGFPDLRLREVADRIMDLKGGNLGARSGIWLQVATQTLCPSFSSKSLEDRGLDEIEQLFLEFASLGDPQVDRGPVESKVR